MSEFLFYRHRPETIVSGILLLFATGFSVCLYCYPPRLELSGRGDKAAEAPAKLSEKGNDFVEKLLGKRLDEYRRDLDSFSTNLKWLAVFSVVSLLIIRKRVGEVDIGTFGLGVPVRLFRLTMPLILGYQLLNFGYYLDGLIDSRIMLFEIIEVHEKTKLDHALPHRSIFSHKELLEDHSFLDNWFLAFPEKKYVPANDDDYWILNRLITVFFAIFFAICHACVFGLIIIEINLQESSQLWRACLWGFLVVVTFVIPMAHIQFTYGGPHYNWFLPVVLFSSIVLIWVATVLLPAAAEKDQVIVQ